MANKQEGKLRVAVIGTGNMGRNHVRNYFMLPESELVAIADVNPEAKSLAEDYKAKFFTDYKEMLEEARPDAVSVVVPTPFHLEVATEVMSRGIHCMLEKPIASSVEEADKLIACAKKNNVTFTVGHIERFNPVIKKLKQMVDDDAIGEITSVVCKRVGGFPAVEPKTDVIIDLAVHDVDIANYLLGQKPKSISSHGSRTRHSRKIDSAEILMDYGRASGFIQANWLTPVKIRKIALTGSLGYLEANYITQELVYYKHNMKKIEKEGFTEFVLQVGDPEKRIIKVDFEEPLAAELKAFLAKAMGRTAAIVDPSDAREALRVSLEAIAPFEK
ncbi:Gfo/Idh/MocA family oxidoreductase [Candidatus Saccharibacteria bacterium oral taxon 488]|jgi:oxidoreductase domain protein|nr:Gfo/Idh/MocA family oxidoreductase [Candidatus Saccharibacteria bacterium oral taxon 488]QHU92528.1 Gfo/Idh/MocA family oxidoreductase [Candidatus Saccharibacteria bacterium oral taxon 488]QJU05440.1 Gfo/Idh/MocA family oxidoreductase [Candidatus Saccharibacteria bacterium oral taxon 488]QJU10535.1 Gfo/Idh/MocA family oxidoreductase [Candidatus Saccharibacteria bacterium oral taxon 488]